MVETVRDKVGGECWSDDSRSGGVLSALFALESGKITAIAALENGKTIEITKVPSPVSNSNLDFRYQADMESVGHVLLMNADPSTTGQDSTFVVNHIINDLEDLGFPVEVSESSVKISPKIS